MRYTEEHLLKYPYFVEVLRENDIHTVTDSLTGLLLRPYVLGFVRYLIDNRIPFTFAMLDLDNFKFINDTYGHQIGDEVLKTVASDLMEYLGEDGLAGRFGGDEYLMINVREMDYSERKEFYQGMYEDYRVLRKNPDLGYCDPFVTGTIGSATYPDDAEDYDGMFALIDKTLYRGKSKGRNCYIIYVESKHKDIEITALHGHGIYTTLHNISVQFDLVFTIEEKLQMVFNTLREDIRITDLFYIGKERRLRSVLDSDLCDDVDDIDDLMQSSDIYPTNNLIDMEDKSLKLYGFMASRSIGSSLIVRVGTREKTHGYLMFAEPFNSRIWQEDDCAALFFLARELEWYIRVSGEIME